MGMGKGVEGVERVGGVGKGGLPKQGKVDDMDGVDVVGRSATNDLY